MACFRWSAEDLEMLAGLCGDLPWPMVGDAFNRWATRAGRPHRTENALLRMCNRRGFARRAVGAWVTSDLVKNLANVSHQRLMRWIRTGELPARRFHQVGHHYIRRKDLRAFARRHPHEFGGVGLSPLVQLFDSEQLAQQIHDMGLLRPMKSKPVRCLETGRRFGSIREAARSCYVTHQRLRMVLGRPNCTANGLHWEVAA